ncbi:formate dehydrogenase subunit gamma, partial [Thermodesulfobacteriota bacterium]
MRKIHVLQKEGELFFHRLTLNERVQHVVIFLSFTLLAVTGLPLKFHHAHWGEVLYSLVGGIAYAPLIHRISAVVMTLCFFYHIFYVLVCSWQNHIVPLKQAGKLTVKSALLALYGLPMVPNLTDIKELFASMKYFFFLTNERPSLVAHGLKEKFGYLAVFWGIPVIGTSGYFLWGESYFTQYFTGNVLNFAFIAHSDEAFLASIVIFIWHIYNVHLTPAVFPMGRAWLNGYMGEQEMLQYHYEDYVCAMQDAGLADRIKPLTQGYVYEGSFFKKLFMKGFMSVMFLAVIVSSYFICKVIYESVFVFGYQIVTTEAEVEMEPLAEPEFIEEIRLGSSDNKTMYRAYRFVQEREVRDHFHRIELGIAPDNTSQCITCHGDLPHGRSEHSRSFLNMHNLYFACQTCHVRPQDGSRLVYYWYSRSSGEIVSDPVIGDEPIDALDIKLTPCETCTGGAD